MSLPQEAGYLYVYSKELVQVNKKIRSLAKKAHKHKSKEEKASSQEKKHKHIIKHRKATSKIESLIKKHNEVLNGLKHHYVKFAHCLQKEHKV